VSTPRGTSLTAKETRLLADLSHHAGLLVRNAQLTVDLERELEVVSARAAELDRSRQEVVVAQDRQRRRLERDIHDGAQQQLVALLVMLRGRLRRMDADGATSTQVDDLRSVLDESREALSRLARGGAPAVLVEAGLLAALEHAAEGVRRVGPAVDVRTDGGWQGSLEADAAVYFCCVEAMLNAVKHAAATQIRISLTSDGDLLGFGVTDDGSGFDPSDAQRGSGLGNLVARVVPFGGHVTVESSPGVGTTVRGWLPASRAGHHAPAGALTGLATP
jgi:signal transduction histidine kinase